jgi:hypothetical protein
MPLRSFQFPGNRCNVKHTLFKGVQLILSYFLNSSSDTKTLDGKDINVDKWLIKDRTHFIFILMPLSNDEFCENQYSKWLLYLTLQSPLVTSCAPKKLYVLSSWHVYLLYTNLGTSKIYFCIQCYLTGFYNPVIKILLCGTKWTFVYDSG